MLLIPAKKFEPLAVALFLPKVDVRNSQVLISKYQLDVHLVVFWGHIAFVPLGFIFDLRLLEVVFIDLFAPQLPKLLELLVELIKIRYLSLSLLHHVNAVPEPKL